MCLRPSDYANKTYIVAGSNSGIGLDMAKRLTRLGTTRIITAVRSATRGADALAQLEAETGEKGVAELWALRLTSYWYASVGAFAGANGDWVACEGMDNRQRHRHQAAHDPADVVYAKFFQQVRHMSRH